MSGQPNPPKPSGPQQFNVQSERMPPNIRSPHQLAAFTAATASGYAPRPQMPSASYISPTTATHTAQPTASSTAQPTAAHTTQPTTTHTTQPTASTTAQPTTTASSTTPQTTSPILSPSQEVSAYYKILDGASSIKPIPAQPVDLDTFKGLKFVTLDGLVISTRDIYDKVSGTYKWEMCESQTDRCVKFIKEDCANKRVFFIASGALGKDIVPQVHDLPQVYAIYIFCSDLTVHVPWGRKHSKVRVVCNDDIRYLVPFLAVDVAQANIDWGDALLRKNDTTKAKDKFTKALDNLENHCKKSDPAMVTYVKNKLEQCK